MRAFPLFLGMLTASVLLHAQDTPPATQAPTITVQSQLVLVPTNVRTKKGQILYGLTAKDFSLEVDGVPQRVQLDESEDVRPIALAVVVQCSRSAIAEWNKLRGLPAMVDAMVGGAPAKVAVVDFGTEPELLTGFTQYAERRNRALAELEPCDDDGGAATLDAVAYANRLFEHTNPPGRRAILLISETRDHGSKVKPEALIRALGRSNVAVESVAFSPARDAAVEDLKHQDGASGGLIGLLLAAVQALRKNVPKELARQTGGEYISFASQNGFDQGLNSLANRVGNFYLLSFQPRFPQPLDTQLDLHPGPLHTIKVTLPGYPSAVVQHRESYWTDLPAAQTGPVPAPR